MELSDWGNLAEVISAIAIIASLIFVGIEIGKNTRATEVANQRALVELFVQHDLTLMTHPELEALVAKAESDPNSVSENEWRTFTRHAFHQFGAWSHAFLARTHGSLPENHWEAVENWGTGWLDGRPGYVKFWSENGAAHSPEFRAYINERRFKNGR